MAKVPLANPFVNALATNAPANVAVITCLFAITEDCNVLRAPFRFPFIAWSTALTAPVDCAKLRAVPASIAEILKLLRALLRGAFLLATIKAVVNSII